MTLIKRLGATDEERLEIQGNVQSRKGFFGLDVPVQAGDVIEEPDPRRGMPPIKRSVRHVEVLHGHGPLDHIEVTWGEPPREPKVSPKPLSIAGLHSRVQAVASTLYADGHVGQAVFEAFKAVEVRIRELSGVDDSGTRLVGAVFGGENPKLRLSRRSGRAGQDEHEGRRLIITGGMTSIRNLGAHESDTHDPESALELVGLASQVMRWLDEVGETGRDA